MAVGADAPSASRQAIVLAVAECLRQTPASVPVDVPLARLGLDSLGCLELMADIEAALGCALPFDAVTEHATIRSLCAAVDDPIVVPDFSFDGMRADAVLASDILPAPSRCPHGLRQATTILLTGATGFLGTSLLRELLDRTSARIICLVRPTHEDGLPHQRDDRGSRRDRVVAVDADLASSLAWVWRIASGGIFANMSTPSIMRARRLTGSGRTGRCVASTSWRRTTFCGWRARPAHRSTSSPACRSATRAMDHGRSMNRSIRFPTSSVSILDMRTRKRLPRRSSGRRGNVGCGRAFIARR